MNIIKHILKKHDFHRDDIYLLSKPQVINWFKNRRGNFIWGYRQGFYVFHFHVNVLGHILSLKPSFFFREYKLIRYVKFWLKLSSVNRLEH